MLMLQVEARLLLGEAGSSSGLAEDVYGPMSGQVTSLARQSFRAALLQADPRLAEAMFLCEVSTTAEALAGEALWHTKFARHFAAISPEIEIHRQ